jgi:hypothetical protein
LSSTVYCLDCTCLVSLLVDTNVPSKVSPTLNSLKFMGHLLFVLHMHDPDSLMPVLTGLCRHGTCALTDSANKASPRTEYVC